MKFFSKCGVALSTLFVAYACYNFYLAASGAWQAPILTAIVSLPFSMLVNVFCDWLQQAMVLDHGTRSTVESIVVAVIGAIEFYLVGWLIERIWQAWSQESD